MKAPSKATLRLIGNEFADGWTLATIRDLFEDAGVVLGPEAAAAGVNGQRRGLMAMYLASLDLTLTADLTKLFSVINTVLLTIAEDAEREAGRGHWLAQIEKQLHRDGVTVDPATHQVVVTAALGLTEGALSALPDASVIREHLDRLYDNIDSDPRLAVSVSKDLVESTAKLVLKEVGLPYTGKEKLPNLVHQAQRALGLSAAQVDAGSGEARQLRTILSALASLTQGITDLRNEVGVGHGRDSVPTWVRPRHARLAAGAAQVWCQLMLETLDDPQAPWRRAVK